MKIQNLYMIVLSILFTASLAAHASPPQTINYQGYLKQKSPDAPFTGSKKLTFKIYDAASGGNLLWTEIQPAVNVAKGQFSVTLGAGSPAVPLALAFDKPYWLGVSVDAEAEMTPRQPLTTVPYAFRAKVAESVSSGSQIVSTLPNGIAPLSVASSTLVPNLNSDMVDGRHAADFLLKTGDTMSGTLNISGSGNMWSANNWQKGLTMNQKGVLLWNKGATGFARGIGTMGDGVLYVGRSAANDISQPAVYDLIIDATGHVGIGTPPSTVAMLNVLGDIKVNGTGNGVAFPDGSRLVTAKKDCNGGRYEDNGNGTVSDCRTGLIWLKNANCTDTYGGYWKYGIDLWENAEAWVGSLKNGMCGLTDGSSAGDWRMPTKTEWMAMHESARKQGFAGPALTNSAGTAQWTQGDPFLNVLADKLYWSSSKDKDPDFYLNYWCIIMSSGSFPTYASTPGNWNYVWPVRSGPLVY